MNRSCRFLTLFVLASLAGCTGYYQRYIPPRQNAPQPVEPPPAQTRPAAPPPEVYVPKEPTVHEVPAAPAPPAVIALMGTAESERQSGELDAAVVTLERAIRIQPRNAKLWNRMAALRLEQYKPKLALDLARKSNTLASGDRELKRDNWRIIAESKRLLGDFEGAARALEEAEQ